MPRIAEKRLAIRSQARFELRCLVTVVLLLLALSATPAVAGNVIFIHPDGAGIAQWQAARFLWKGPDANLNWDLLPNVAVYRGHMSDNLTATSNGGATTHGYGVRASEAAFGSDGRTAGRLRAASGQSESLMHEAMRKGLKTGIINSGSIIEPGTACFVASVAHRQEEESIAEQVIESGADFILSGGEEWLLPEGQAGRHVRSGRRTDGRNLIEWAKAHGYAVAFDRHELHSVPAGTKKLLGVFAAQDTFNDMTEEELAALGLPYYSEQAPTLAEMLEKFLSLCGSERFFLVVEEEGSDNFGNLNNARGVLEALRRADEAFAIALKQAGAGSDTLVLTTADSEAGDMDVIGLDAGDPAALAVAANRRDSNGAPYDLFEKRVPFESAPDKEGRRHRFVITWGSRRDTSGGIVVRAAGKNSERVNGSFDNTRIYELMRATLFEGAD